MLNVRGLQVFYGNIHAIKDVSFYVEEGEIVTLIGANGAGKSTILNTVSGLIRPTAGTIEFLGHSILNLTCLLYTSSEWIDYKDISGNNCVRKAVIPFWRSLYTLG